MIPRNCNCGTYFPMTTSTTVSGVLSNRPMRPQSHVQNTAATMMATVDRPVLAPYSHGSRTLLVINSIATNRMMVSRNCCDPGNLANEISTGSEQPIQTPM